MATALGPERALDTPVMQSMEEPPTRSLPIPISLDDSVSYQSPFASPLPSPRNISAPPPNPPFVFPSRPSSSSAPSSFSRATGRRPRSAIETQERSSFGMDREQVDPPSKSPALPAFSFNPGASLPADTNPALLSPPLSPQIPLPIPSPSRPGGHGHKRGGSEFVGGNIRAGEAITVMSTSPTKSESGFASPTFQPPPRPAGRRGHAHRRSAAISSHDLSLILQPPSTNSIQRGSSAPTSPAEFDRRLESPPLDNLDRSLKTAESEPTLKRSEEAEKPKAIEDVASVKPPSPSKPMNRARVGFSDTLEFIPRPLSLVSSDTSSTMTARPSHSVSDSISSIMSNMTPITAEKEHIPTVGPSPTRQGTESRPSTAGAVLERSQSIQSVDRSGSSPRRRNSIPALINVADANATIEPGTPSPTKTPKRWSFFGLEPFAGPSSPVRSRPLSSSSTDSTSKPANSASSSSDHISDLPVDAPDASPLHQKRAGKKSNKKKKKVKHWAGSILTRKSKPRSKKTKDATSRSATPTLPKAVDDEDELTADEAQQEPAVEPVTPTVTITDSSNPSQPPQPWKPRSLSSLDDEASYPVIDLDAALGPFNTPLPRNAEWEAAQKAAGNSKRQLHSAQGMKGFSGPGMHYHRRAESAPEMVPFEGGRFIHRFGSSSTMADVFEEDEEDDDHSGKTTPLEGKEIGSDDSDMSSDDATPPAIILVKDPIIELAPRTSEDSFRLSASVPIDADKAKPTASMKSGRSMSSMHEEVVAEEPRGIEFRSGVFHDNTDATDSATPSPRRILASRDLAPVDISPLHLPTPSQIPVSPYSMSHASSFPSPRSPMSYDAQRISTAPSSVNDENNFQSLLLGEPGPEVRISVDDIPSLTSSNSTMTRDSTFAAQNPQLAHIPFRPDQRPASVSSAAFGRRRSSLASLSRLISSSHGERSKLSMEVPLDNDSEKKQKVSRAKRLSRMVQFWRPSKETPTT